MNYGSDPYWAWKHGMDPYQRQAYENQVMIDRAAGERHRNEFDAAAVVTGALLLGNWFQGRAARKAAKARAQYVSTHRPHDYEVRKAELDFAAQQLHAEALTVIGHVEAEIVQLEARLPLAGTAKVGGSIKSQLDALRTQLKNETLAYRTALKTLHENYRDIMEFEARLLELVDGAAGAEHQTPLYAGRLPTVVSAATMDLLTHAVRSEQLVWLSMAEADGTTSEHEVLPVSLSRGSLRGHERGQGGLATFAVQHITAVRLLHHNN